MKFSSFWKKPFNWALIILTLFLIFQYFSRYNANTKMENLTIDSLFLTTLDGEKIDLLEKSKLPLVLFFWSSSCPPCLVEIERFKNAMNRGLPKDQVIFINTYEPLSTIKKFIPKKEIAYPVYKGTLQALSLLNISLTPTVIHLDEERKIVHYSTGVGPLTIIKAEKFLKKD